jgi:hypothetical protein
MTGTHNSLLIPWLMNVEKYDEAAVLYKKKSSAG